MRLLPLPLLLRLRWQGAIQGTYNCLLKLSKLCALLGHLQGSTAMYPDAKEHMMVRNKQAQVSTCVHQGTYILYVCTLLVVVCATNVRSLTTARWTSTSTHECTNTHAPMYARTHARTHACTHTHIHKHTGQAIVHNLHTYKPLLTSF